MARLTSEGLAPLIERQMAMYRAQQRAAADAAARGATQEADRLPCLAAPYVTISRQYGAGGSRLAQLVAERLGWALYDRALVEAIAKDARLQDELLSPLDERERSDMEAWIRGLLTEETLSEHHYTRSLFRVLSSVANVGFAVIVGRGAHLALPADNGLRVRVYAPAEYRVQQIAQRENLPESEAREKVARIERTRQLWLIRAYGKSAKEPMAFDLAINPAVIPMDACVDIVLKALEAKCGLEVLRRPDLTP